MDVVPPGDPDSWLGIDPFSADIREGALYGRGACDMKAGAVANLAVLRTLRAAGVRLERPLALHFVVGEEDGGLGAFATLRRGHRGDAAVIAEPTGAKVITATAGALTFRIEVTGRSAHGSMRNEGVSAFEAFLPIHAALVGLEADRNRDPDPTFLGKTPYALSFGVVRAGSGRAASPTGSWPRAGSGCGSTRTRGSRAPRFEDVVTEVAVKDPWLRDHRPHVTWPGGQFASGSTDADHPLGRGDVVGRRRDRRGAPADRRPGSTAATCGSTPASAASPRSTTVPATSRTRTRRSRRSTSTSWCRSPAR